MYRVGIYSVKEQMDILTVRLRYLLRRLEDEV